MSIRTLGILGIIGGVSLTAVEMRHLISAIPLDGRNMDHPDELLYAFWAIGALCIFWAIFKLGVTGKNRIMHSVPLIAMAGFVALVIGSMIDVVGLAQTGTNPVFLAAYPLILIGTLMTAIFALIDRSWRGWRKFAPLVCVLAIPTALLVGTVTGEASNLLFGLSWIILGLAVLTSKPELSYQMAEGAI
jgi:hypothetical protein